MNARGEMTDEVQLSEADLERRRERRTETLAGWERLGLILPGWSLEEQEDNESPVATFSTKDTAYAIGGVEWDHYRKGVADALKLVGVHVPGPERKLHNPLHTISVTAFATHGDQAVVLRRRIFFDGKQRNKYRAVLAGGGLFRSPEELEVFTALAAMLLRDPLEEIAVYFSRPSTYVVWLGILNGGSFSTDDPFVMGILGRVRPLLPAVRVETSRNDLAPEEEFLKDARARRTLDPVITWIETWSLNDQSTPIIVGTCECGRLTYARDSVRRVLVEKRRTWRGPVPPTGVYPCPTSPYWHLTTHGRWQRHLKEQAALNSGDAEPAGLGDSDA